MRTIDLNADVGEGFDDTDAALLPLVTSANIACGGHAGDADTMAATVVRCLAHGVAIGAHPSYPDRAGFGRREMALSAEALDASIRAQIRSLMRIASASGARLSHVKPHGALYNRAAVDPAVAAIVANAVREVDPALALVGLAGSHLLAAGRAAGLRVVSEGFADRRYTAEGVLVPRSDAAALITDAEAASEQVRRMLLERRVTSVDGKDVALEIDTVCLHGDGPHAITFAHRLRAALAAAGVRPQAVSS